MPRDKPNRRGARRPAGHRARLVVVRAPRMAMRRAGPERRLRVALLCIFAGRLVQVEGFDSAAYKTASAQWHPPDYIPLPAVRGAITTSDGAVLAMTVQTETVFADPKLIPVVNRPQVAA